MVGREMLAVIGQDRVDLAQGAVCEQLPQHVELGQEVGPVRFHQENALRQRRFGQLPRLRCVQRQRLLDQYVLARLDSRERAREVLMVGVAT